jgi:hypothetical protein
MNFAIKIDGHDRHPGREAPHRFSKFGLFESLPIGWHIVAARGPYCAALQNSASDI